MRSPFPRLVARWIPLAPLAAVLAFANAAAAQQPPAQVFAATRAAIQHQQYTKSEQLGFSIMKSAYSDLPTQGAVLVGFEVQLARFSKLEIVHAFRPIYATETGRITTQTFGVFGAQANKKTTDLTRVIRVQAPQGFAVGSITIRRGLYIDGMRLAYHRINGAALNPNDAVTSEWIGNNQGGHAEKTLGGNGAPIIGIHGNMDERRVLAVGVYQLPSVAPPPPRPNVQPRPDRPAVARQEPAPPRPDVKPGEERPAAVRQEPAPKKVVPEPEPKPAEAARAEAAEGLGPDDVAAPAVQVREPEPSAWLLPIGIVACLGGVAFFSCWLLLGQQTEPTRRKTRSTPPPLPEPTPRKPRTTPPPLPAGFGEPPVAREVDATAVTAKPPAPLPPAEGAFTEKPIAERRPASLEVPAEVPSIVREQPPYFHARAANTLKVNRFYRVYVLRDMLLFLDAGPEANYQFTHGVGAAGAAAGGILGAAVGQAIGSIIDGARQDTREARRRLLDTASTEELIQRTADEDTSFRALTVDLRNSRIEPPTTWHTMQHLGNQYVGLLYFEHPEQGKMKLELPTPNDMRIALAELPTALGDQLVVNVVLDRRSWQYVAK